MGRAGIGESDRDDLIQGFVLDLIARAGRFNSQKGSWEAFVIVVCENRYATILEHRCAGSRSQKSEAGSLNRPIYDAEGNRTEFGATMDESAQARRTGQYRRSCQEVCDLAEDLAYVLDQMPPTMRKNCNLLMRGSKVEAARQLGVSHGSLYETIGRILVRFEKAGLRDYLS